ncbi:MAG: hypothetical protein GF401_00390 [Chitinivibrionales bacterium]|nr:hypothetical protein [Chitinivibrionales bacterium]
MKKYLAHVTILAILSMQSAGHCAMPDHQHPPYDDDLFDSNWGHGGRIYQQLFWEADPDLSSSSTVSTATRLNDEDYAQGIMPIIGLMMWSSTYDGGDPSSDPCVEAYRNWNQTREHYFVRKPDGTVWSRSYQSDGDPKDAWISPNRPLDTDDPDRESNVTTYGEWYAERIARRCAAINAGGVSLADYADMIPHSSVKEQDFSESIVKDFEQWSGISVAGSSVSAHATDIRDNHFSTWTDYMCNMYGGWWAEMIKRIEAKTGKKAICVMQKHIFAHGLRYGGADPIWMRKNIDDGKRFYYHVESWSMPHDRGVGGGQLSAYTAQVGTHLCREPDISRGIFMPITNSDSYPGDNRTGTDQYAAIDRSEAKSFSNAEKTELQHKLMDGAWMLLGWTHLAARSGEVERAGEYILTHATKEIWPKALYENIVRQSYPTRPYGAGFYYSTTIEKALEDDGQQQYDPLDKIGEKARGVSNGNFFPGYYVGNSGLENLQPSAYPTVWVTDGLSLLSDTERQKLESIAPLYDIENVNQIPVSLTPVRFEGDVTGYAFVDQNERVIIIATRDYIDNKSGITAKVALHGIDNGSYRASDVQSNDIFDFTVSGGNGSFEFSLERWETRAFVTNLPPLAQATVAWSKQHLSNAPVGIRNAALQDAEIIDMLGRSVKGISHRNTHTPPKGVYFLRDRSSGMSKARKIFMD